jgi:hypothetical protein
MFFLVRNNYFKMERCDMYVKTIKYDKCYNIIKINPCLKIRSSHFSGKSQDTKCGRKKFWLGIQKTTCQ